MAVDGSKHGYLVFEPGAITVIVERTERNESEEEGGLLGRFTALTLAVEDIETAVNQWSSGEEKGIKGQDDEIKEIEGSNLILQAIAWSEISKDRMAVINDSILREGGDVDGYLIVRINEDDVIFEQNGERYRLPFRP